MNKDLTPLDANSKARIRDRLKRELAYLHALGVPPHRFLAARQARSECLCKPAPPLDTDSGSATDLEAVRALAKHVREDMRPYIDEARRALVAQVRTLSAQSPSPQLDEALELLWALKIFDPANAQLVEASESLHRIAHSEAVRNESTGGAMRLGN